MVKSTSATERDLMRIRTRSSLGIATALGALAVAVTAQGATADQVLVCHGTASATNSLVLIEVSRNALNGHFDLLAGVVVGAGHGKQNAPDQWTELNGTGGTGFTDVCLDLYNATYGGPFLL
jgi:hypothetical protein